MSAKEENLKSRFPVVGIGASAGGLEAFSLLVKNLEFNTGMAFVLVQHLDPSHESILAELLVKQTRMPVTLVENGITIQPNAIYVIPPNARMTIADYRLFLQPRDRPEGGQHIIDSFLSSLAAAHKDNAIGA